MKRRKDKNLAEGEVTGHAHICTDEDVEVFDLDGGENTANGSTERLLKAPYGTGIVHQEHKKVDLPAGTYDISRQREINPDTEEARAVKD